MQQNAKTSKVIELGSLFGNGALSDTIWVSTLFCSTTTPTAIPNQLKKCVLQMIFFPNPIFEILKI